MKRTIFPILSLCTLALASCQKNGFDTVYAGGDDIVRFAPSVVGTDVLTKGTLINEGGPDAIAFDTSSSFFVTAWDNAATPNNIIPGTAGTYQEVKMKGTQWNTVYTNGGKEYSREYLWKSGEVKTFFAYAYLPAGDVVASIIPGAGEDPAQELTHTVSSTSTAQADILMGFYKGDGKTGPAGSQKMTGTAGIVFSHPLTAVKFKQGTLPAGTSIKSISIKGVYPSGKAEMNPTTAVEEDSKDRFIWTKTDGSAFTKTDETLTVSLGSVTVASGTKQIGDAFLLIPQTFAADGTARIEVVLKDDNKAGKELNLYYPLAETEWAAGYTNTYTINFNGIVSADKPEMYNGSSLEDNKINGHEFVEIEAKYDGTNITTLKWATCNVGATSPEEYGEYFAWGETTGHKANLETKKYVDGHSFDWSTAPFNNYSFSYNATYFSSVRSTVCPDDILALDYDAARVNWGSSWRMPTKVEFQALIDATKWTWDSKNKGYFLTKSGETLSGDKSNALLFVPAAGIGSYVNLIDAGSYVSYWSSTLDSSSPTSATVLCSGAQLIHSEFRNNSMPVRPVSD